VELRFDNFSESVIGFPLCPITLKPSLSMPDRFRTRQPAPAQSRSTRRLRMCSRAPNMPRTFLR
jgi:hypothetical protein